MPTRRIVHPAPARNNGANEPSATIRAPALHTFARQRRPELLDLRALGRLRQRAPVVRAVAPSRHRHLRVLGARRGVR